MVEITDQNREDVIRSYCHRLLDDMDWDTMYSFAYSMLKNDKDDYNNEQLESEIKDYYPDILSD